MILDRAGAPRAGGIDRVVMAAGAALALACAALASLHATTHADAGAADDVRPPAIAGKFYPGDAATLGRALDTMLARALPGRTVSPIAIVAPHAGYVYSGQIAADAFSHVRDQAFDVVVIVAPNHTSAGFGRIAVLPGSGMRTPLGVAPLEGGIATALMKADAEVVANADVHASEHAVELQVPFVQRLWPRARVVAVVVGTEDLGRCLRFGRALARVVQGRRALLVASSDLSHYPKADDARTTDTRTLEAVATLDPGRVETVAREALGRGVPGLSTAACGLGPILAVMAASRELGANRAHVVSYAHSGDLPVGPSNRVVGYGAVVFSAGTPGSDTTTLTAREADQTGTSLTSAEKDALLVLARSTVSDFLSSSTLPLPRGHASLASRRQGAFVTIRKKGELRGCTGDIEPDRPLPQLVSLVAFASAFEDTRFRPVTAAELDELTFEISLLTPPRAVSSPTQIVAGRDGVVLRKSSRRAVFLPQVATEEGWTRDALLDRLCEKAGLPATCWRSGASLSTFQAEVFQEKR